MAMHGDDHYVYLEALSVADPAAYRVLKFEANFFNINHVGELRNQHGRIVNTVFKISDIVPSGTSQDTIVRVIELLAEICDLTVTDHFANPYTKPDYDGITGKFEQILELFPVTRGLPGPALPASVMQ